MKLLKFMPQQLTQGMLPSLLISQMRSSFVSKYARLSGPMSMLSMSNVALQAEEPAQRGGCCQLFSNHWMCSQQYMQQTTHQIYLHMG